MLKRELKHALEERLAALADLSPKGKVVWLIAHLEEYVERLLGFTALPHTTMNALVNSDLFALVQVAAELVTEEIERALVSPVLREEWLSFLQQLAVVAGMNDKQELNRLRSITDVRNALE